MNERMRRHSQWISLAALLVALGAVGYAVARPVPRPASLPGWQINPSPPADVAPIPAAAATCAIAPQLRAHVYRPQRLTLLQECTVVSGVVRLVRHEADGDLHVMLREDTGQPVLTNAINQAQQNGDLVVEPVCLYSRLSQPDAKIPCQGALQTPGAELLQPGAHVRVTGDYVTDTQHGWNEIHVVTLVELL